MSVQPIPDGYYTATAYLIANDAAAAIEFYKTVFGATELMRLPGPGGKIMHAEIKIGNSPIMLADEFPEMNFLGPKSLGGSPVGILLYVDDCDTMFQRAIEAGAIEKKPMADQFYGDRSGTVEDPFGHVWTIATHVEDLTQDEIDKRFQAQMQQHGDACDA